MARVIEHNDEAGVERRPVGREVEDEVAVDLLDLGFGDGQTLFHGEGTSGYFMAITALSAVGGSGCRAALWNPALVNMER